MDTRIEKIIDDRIRNIQIKIRKRQILKLEIVRYQNQKQVSTRIKDRQKGKNIYVDRLIRSDEKYIDK